jgi:ATP-binding protein involved in chromosome partitioning
MMKKITEQQVLDALKKVQDPELGQDLVALNMIRDIKILADKVTFTLVITTPACPLRNQLEHDCKEAVLSIEGIKEVELKVESHVIPSQTKPDMLELPIKHTIAIGSGKGGVGKSTVAINLAIAFSQTGASVGLLDADIYGPNIPEMLGIKSLPQQNGQKLKPAAAYGLKVMSTGFLIQKNQPLIWRGPMLHSAIRQFLTDVEWGNLDYLIIDLPPGTGDVQLSLSQTISLSGGVIVTMPQQVSLDDAARALVMFKKLNVPVLGVIENMSYLKLPDGSNTYIFGSGGGKKLADENCVPFLGMIELYPKIREGGDKGIPIMISEPNSQPASVFKKITGTIAGELSTNTLLHK